MNVRSGVDNGDAARVRCVRVLITKYKKAFLPQNMALGICAPLVLFMSRALLRV